MVKVTVPVGGADSEMVGLMVAVNSRLLPGRGVEVAGVKKTVGVVLDTVMTTWGDVDPE